jgi:restriction system protein
MKQTVNDAITEILKQANKALDPKQIYEMIMQKKLYNFKSSSPENIVRNQLRRHSENLPGSRADSKRKLYVFESGKFRLK